jgi:hypothetical protein
MPTATRSRVTAALLVATLALTGCQTYTAQTQARDDSVRSGDIASAAAQADRDAEKNKDNKDTILYRLEQGAILRSAALANIAAPAAAHVEPVADRLPPSNNQTQTNQALNEAPPEAISPRIGYLTRSLAAFDEAARRIDDYEAKAKLKVGSEAGALLTNQANLPYRGRAYDKVMLHTYQALNYLQLADPDAARVELNRALQRQRDAVEANAKRIEEAQELAKEAESGGVKDEKGRQGKSYDVDRAKKDPKTSAALAGLEAKLDEAILPYGDYVNPFTTFLDALVFTHQAADASDLERGRKSWERVLNFAPDNPYVREDYIAAEPDLQIPPSSSDVGLSVSSSSAPTTPAESPTNPSDPTPPSSLPAPGSAPAVATAETPAVAADTVVAPAAPVTPPLPPAPHGITYVIFETGSAPYRDQTRIDIPLFVVTGRISYVGMALPRIERVSGQLGRLQVTSGGASYTTATVASMDSVVAQDFKNEWPSILTKTLISTATKATIDAIIQKQIEDQGGAALGLLAKVATAAIQASVNIADTRTWRSLPKEFAYARIPTPADHQLTLATPGLSQTVSLEQAAVQVIYVKSTSSASPLLVGQFILKK